MENKAIELNLGQYSDKIRNNFLVELYYYIIKNKNSNYIEFFFPRAVFDNININIFDRIFESFTVEKVRKDKIFKLSQSSKYLMNEISMPLIYTHDLIRSLEIGCDEKENVELVEVIVQGRVCCLSNITIKELQGLNWNRMMIFEDILNEDSFIFGSYDFQKYIIARNLSLYDEKYIETLSNKYFDVDEKLEP